MNKQNIFDINVNPFDVSRIKPLDIFVKSENNNPLSIDGTNVLKVDEIFKPDISIPDYSFNPIPLFSNSQASVNNSTKSYTGKIVDEYGETIPWATINSNNDNNIYTQADDFGNYNINVPESHNVTISSVGFEPLTIPASQLTSSIVLKMDTANQLDEVVVIGKSKKEINYTPFVVAGLGLTVLGIAIAISKKNKAGLSGPTCNNRTKCKGLLKNGKLRKGYKYGKGGKVIKVASKVGLSGVVEVTI